MSGHRMPTGGTLRRTDRRRLAWQGAVAQLRRAPIACNRVGAPAVASRRCWLQLHTRFRSRGARA
jgi:hypothetical protein